MNRFHFFLVRCIGAFLFALVVLPGPSWSQQRAADSYPSRVVTIIVPFAPGANTDIETRIYAQKLSEILGQSFLVDYKPGAGSTIGGAYVARSAPDGYTLMSATPSVSAAALQYKIMTYDPLKDFSYVSLMTKRPYLFVGSNKIPIKDPKEYLAYVRANPGKINFATSGNGSAGHLFAEWLHQVTKMDVTFIHFKGAGPSTAAVMSGEVDAVFVSVAAMMNQIKAGKARIIGVTSQKRLKMLPDVPTVSEQVLQGWEFSSWYGFAGPSAIPRPTIDRLASALAKIAKDPELEQKFSADGTEMIGSSSEQFKQFVASEFNRLKKVVEDGGIKLGD
ncbi:MAG: hypothetical protein JW384_01820 [Nitrosomonadaceae bacterium]|nr:hypothetical protein [Nitrosomonadaceae bacterium]